MPTTRTMPTKPNVSGEHALDRASSVMTSSNDHPADGHDLIRVQGARVNNLKDVRYHGYPQAGWPGSSGMQPTYFPGTST